MDAMAVLPTTVDTSSPSSAPASVSGDSQNVGAGNSSDGGFAALFQQLTDPQASQTAQSPLQEIMDLLSGVGTQDPLKALSPEELAAFQALLQGQGNGKSADGDKVASTLMDLGTAAKTKASDKSQDPLTMLTALLQDLQNLLQQLLPTLTSMPGGQGNLQDSLGSGKDLTSLSPEQLGVLLEELQRKLAELMGNLATQGKGDSSQGSMVEPPVASNAQDLQALGQKSQELVKRIQQMLSDLASGKASPMLQQGENTQQASTQSASATQDNATAPVQSIADVINPLNPNQKLAEEFRHHQRREHGNARTDQAQVKPASEAATAAVATPPSSDADAAVQAISDAVSPKAVQTSEGKFKLAEASAVDSLTPVQDEKKNLAAPTPVEQTAQSRMLERIEAHQAVRQVASRVAWMVQNGEGRAIIRLDPPELGHVEIQVDSKPGEIKVHMIVEDASVKQALDASVSKLRDSMEQHQIKLEKLEVSVDSGRPETQAGSKDPSQSRGHGNGSRNRGTIFADVIVESPTSDTGRRLGYNTMELIA